MPRQVQKQKILAKRTPAPPGGWAARLDSLVAASPAPSKDGNEVEPAGADDDHQLDVVTDDYLSSTKVWEVKLLSQPKAAASAAVRGEWDEAVRYEIPFGRAFARDGAQHVRLDGRYKRDGEWEAMRKVGTIDFNGTTYNVDDIVVVRPSRGDEKWTATIQAPDDDKRKMAVHPKNTWIASIFELRIQGSKRWALVAWLYWPSDLQQAHCSNEEPKDGRKGYHGEHELVASNHLDIMDVRTFDRVFNEDINVCFESDGEVLREYYWRQTYDIRDQSLSELPRYCRCNKFWKPDTVLLQCTSCSIWMHPECVVHDVLSDQWRGIAQAEGRLLGRARTGPKSDKNSPFIDTHRYSHRLEGRMSEGGSKVVVRETRTVGGVLTVQSCEVGVRCLLCATSFA